MSEPKIFPGNRNSNLKSQSGAINSPGEPSEQSVNNFKVRSSLVSDVKINSSHKIVANKISSSARDSYPKCSATSGHPCVDNQEYDDKRAYPGSSLAGMNAAGFSPYYNSQESHADSSKFIASIGNTLSLVALKYPLLTVGKISGTGSTLITIKENPELGIAGFGASLGVSKYLKAIPDMSPVTAYRGGIMTEMAVSNSTVPMISPIKENK